MSLECMRFLVLFAKINRNYTACAHSIERIVTADFFWSRCFSLSCSYFCYNHLWSIAFAFVCEQAPKSLGNIIQLAFAVVAMFFAQLIISLLPYSYAMYLLISSMCSMLISHSHSHLCRKCIFNMDERKQYRWARSGQTKSVYFL